MVGLRLIFSVFLLWGGFRRFTDSNEAVSLEGTGLVSMLSEDNIND